MRKFKAYTLIEILVVFSMMAILAGLAYPLLRHFFERSNDLLLQMQLLHAIQYAKGEATIRHHAVAICKSSNHRSCSGQWLDGLLIFMDENNDGIVHDQNHILSILTMPAQEGRLFWQSFPVYHTYVAFSKHGLVSSDNGTFWYCQYGKTYPSWAVVLNRLGETHVIYPNKQGFIRNSRGRILRCSE